MTNKHSGDSFDDFLVAEGIYEEAKAEALADVLNWIATEMEQQQMSKSKLANQMGTSRSQVDRLVNHHVEDVKLSTLIKAAHAFGKSIHFSLVDIAK